jgi:diadenosine tetraphosphatase ApaH/serine/threonine PP2A family protein phosphatase
MVVGDLHGHIGATLWVVARFLLERGTHMVALGDYVDRGPHQLETMVALLLLRERMPDRVTLLRGNHETGVFTWGFGFRDEVRTSFPESTYNLFLDLFAELPIVAHRPDGVLLLHGGIPSGASSLEAIVAVQKQGRDIEDPVVREILLNDPMEMPGGFSPNYARGIGQSFGLDATEALMARGALKLLVRAHEPVPGGLRHSHTGRVLTVFSHPDYKGSGMEGAVVFVGLDGDVRSETIDVVIS